MLYKRFACIADAGGPAVLQDFINHNVFQLKIFRNLALQ